MANVVPYRPSPSPEGGADVISFPSHLARPSNIPRFADAQVAAPREETLVEELNRVIANIGRLSAPREGI